jgi:hypothetical protein
MPLIPWWSRIFRRSHQIVVMAAQSETSSAGRRDAVHKILERISDEAPSLVAGCSEIDRRIRDLHQFLYSPDDHGAETGRRFGEQPINVPVIYKGSPPGRGSLHRQSRPSRLSRYALARLRRACRIALLEAGGVGSLDEIRILIRCRRSLRPRSSRMPSGAHSIA